MTGASVFGEELIDRLRAEYEHVDVYAIAASTLAMVRRRTVRNPQGLLVSRVRMASRHKAIALGTTADSAELHRYVALHVEIYREASSGLSPDQIADKLEHARPRYPRLNPFLIDALRELGDSWPTEAQPC